jgi:hypothetical protein
VLHVARRAHPGRTRSCGSWSRRYRVSGSVVIVVVVIGVPISMVGMIPVVLIATVGVTVVSIPTLVFATVVPLAKEAASCERERNSEQAGDPDHAASQPRRSCAPHDDTHYVTSNDDVAPPGQRTVRSGALLALAAAHRLAAGDLATPLLATGSRPHAVLAKSRTHDRRAGSRQSPTGPRRFACDRRDTCALVRWQPASDSSELDAKQKNPGFASGASATIGVSTTPTSLRAAWTALGYRCAAASSDRSRTRGSEPYRCASGAPPVERCMERLETALHVANHDDWRTLLMVAEYPAYTACAVRGQAAVDEDHAEHVAWFRR